MKKIFISLLGAFLALGAMAQPTFVSTTPANKNVVLEEYTGINCGYCPDGHKLANIFANANAGRVFLINIHQGSFANATPNYTTQWGNALAAQTGLNGYPSGTVNRRVFTGTNTALNRSEWAAKGPIVLSETSFVNVAAKSQIDMATRTLTVDVEVYYTGNADDNSNKLNVALLQNNVLGPQGGMTSNPGQVINGQYNHMHMLRHLITGQWGDELKVESGNIPAGTFFTKTYTYELPQDINDIPLMVKDLEIVVFVAKNNQVIYTGSACTPEIIKPEYGASITSYNVEDIPCSEYVNQSIKVLNIGNETITSMVIDTKIFGLSLTSEWEGSIASFETAEINLSVLEVQEGIDNELQANIITVNGKPNISSVDKTLFKPLAGQNGVTLNLKLDRYGSETTWTLKNSSGGLIKSGGPYTDGTTGRLQVIDLEVTESDCYTFEIRDKYNDGINAGYLVGGYTIVDGDGKTLVVSDGKFTTSQTKGFGYGDYIGIEEVLVEKNVSVNVYPNPVRDIANLEISLNSSSDAAIQVVDMLGRNIIDLGTKSMKAGQNTIQLNTSNLNNGMYFVKVSTDNGVISKKITVS
ncbi:MAG TPA: Omp28-related outer membrane protein, partial [Bacteroidales bacterium]|nr:Omp28-related outer membrane protein [Bacteroidales bacterium]